MKTQITILQFLKCLGVIFQTLTLIEDLAVPYQTQLGQLLEDLCGGTRGFPGGIKVFHANQPAAVVCPGIDIAGYGGDYGSEMQGSGRGRCESANIGRVWFADLRNRVD